MISRGNKPRGKKRTKHRASQRFAEDAWQKRLAWLRRPQIHRSIEVETDEEAAERARRQNGLAKKLG